MLVWITENIGTLLISAALCAAVAGIIATIARDKKKGRSPCGGNCGHCPMSGACHKGD